MSNYRIRQLFATLAETEAANPTLLEGEVWIEKDGGTGQATGRRKTGDGVTAFTALPFDPGGTGGSGTGDVVGPSSSVDGRAAVFSGTTGKLLRQASAAPVLEGDARLTDARTPTSHAASHGSSGSDAITVAQSQVTGLSAALAAKADSSALATVATSGAYSDLSGRPTLGTAAATDATAYAPAAEGVTNGNSHDHSGGDGAQIAYGSLSGLPTLGSAAAAATGDFTPAAHVGSGGTAHANSVASGAAGFMTGADKAKLDGVASGATANATDAALRDRATHTGTQTASTISDFNSSSRAQTEAALIAGANVTITPAGSGATRTLTIAASGGGGATNLSYDAGSRVIASDTGTDATLPLVSSTEAGLAPASGGGTSNFLRADGTWQTPAGGGNVSNSGTPTAGQIAEWTNATTIQGVAVTGTGNVVRATSPTLVTPALGIPASGDLSNCTFPTLNQSTTGSAATLTTSRNIGGSPFNGSADVTSFPSPGAIGGTTPAAGTFTTLEARSATSLLLGTAGSAVGSVGFRNATSGSITVQPTTGALGTATVTLPAVTGTAVVAATSTTTTQALFATATAGAPAFRAIAAGDIPTLNQNTTGSAATLTTTRTIGGSNFNGSANVTSFPAPGAIGGTTPSTGVFTTLEARSATSLLLGTAGSAVGSVGFRNATSGTITLAPPTGALGTVTLTLPAVTDTVAALAATQTLTNKTLGNLTETVFTVVDGASVDLDPANGPIQQWTLGANRTPTATNFTAGESMMLMVADGTAFAITWTTMGVVWVGGTAPTLATSGWTVLEFWRVGSTTYGARVGDVA